VIPVHRRQDGSEDELVGALFDLPGQAGDPRMERVMDEVATVAQRLREATPPDEPPARWPEASGRVLVEVAGQGMAQVIERTLRDQGYQVAVCGGPAALPRHRCPLVETGTCPLADGADLLVYALDVEDADDREVLEAHRLHPERPACVVVPPALVDRYRSLLRSYEVVEAPLTPEKLVDALRRLRERDAARRAGPGVPVGKGRPLERRLLFESPAWGIALCLPEHQRHGRIPGGWSTEDAQP
jgi:hypothetical protein